MQIVNMTKHQVMQIRVLRKMVFDFTSFLKEKKGDPINAVFVQDVEDNFRDAFKAIFDLDNGIAEKIERLGKEKR